jgi:energy-coupling factor transport system permease protein
VSPRRGGVAAVLMRELPGPSAVHGMWAGTKLVCAFVLVVVVVVFPGWAAVVSGGVLVLGAAVAARVPRTALPRLPVWLWFFLLVTAGLATLGQGLVLYAKSVLLTIVLLGAAAVITWTTPMPRLAPAVAVLGSPLRGLGLPVDEWVITLTLCLRSLPMLTEECRILFAARRLRPASRSRRPSVLVGELVDLCTALLAVATRRANEVGHAVTARGGLPVPHPVRPNLCRADVIAFAATGVAATTVVILAFVG